jgi:hypothetical protein
MKAIRLTLLWVLPVLIAGIITYFLFQESKFQRQESAFQLARQKSQKGWTLSLDYREGNWWSDCGGGKIIIDKEQRVWLAGQCKAHGIHVFDGTKWRTYFPENFTSNIRNLALDARGRVWIVGDDGQGWMYFDGETWVRSQRPLTEEAPQPTDPSPGNVDRHGRRWAWNDSEVHVLDKTGRITLTPENSGLAAGGIYALEVDASGRIWIANNEGVNVFDGGEIQTVPTELIDQRHKILESRESTKGYSWFFPSVLGLLWIAAYLNMNILSPAVVLFVLGLLLTRLLGPAAGLSYTHIPYVNPGVILAYSGMLGGMIGRIIDNARGTSGRFAWANWLPIIIGVPAAVIAFLWAFLFAFYY